MLPAVRWNIAVSPDTDRSVRRFIASQDGDRKDDLSRFIKEAVRSHFLELPPKQAKAANTDVSEQNLTSMAEEVVQWARISVSTLAAPG
jgi:hypothetical protein